ncbi:MAG: hypothetical protein BM556_08450 [Bacteriovorax sp. MedPE-SWde]|nr:MAG: hypothetical protein BM556_08450 [Bacteriovorax sp. MedPE-SWde]
MNIKSCLITAAGLGTRMGEIGKKLPKPLWPIFDKNLLDLQVEYAKNLGVEKIYINTHHHKDKINDWARDKDVIILEEELLLGSGGCIHNLKNTIKEDIGIILIINSDQFYFVEKEFINAAYRMMLRDGVNSHLIGIEVDKTEKYNETCLVNNYLNDIKKPSGESSYITYSGVGLINIDNIEYVSGESSFFKSVCDYKKEKVRLTTPTNREYWDFGTKEKYLENIFKLLEDKENEMYKFLVSAKAIPKNIIDLKAVPNIIEMCSGELILSKKESSYSISYKELTSLP